MIEKSEYVSKYVFLEQGVTYEREHGVTTSTI